MHHATDVPLSDKEAQLLAKYAEEQGITVEDAAARLAKGELVRRFGGPRPLNARVIPLRRR